MGDQTQTETQTQTDPGQTGGGEVMIPKPRLDQEIAKRVAVEQQLQERERRYAEDAEIYRAFGTFDEDLAYATRLAHERTPAEGRLALKEFAAQQAANPAQAHPFIRGFFAGGVSAPPAAPPAGAGQGNAAAPGAQQPPAAPPAGQRRDWQDESRQEAVVPPYRPAAPPRPTPPAPPPGPPSDPRKDLKAATEAYRADPSPENKARLQSAKSTAARMR
jgi:hypothetical protein